MCGLFGWQLDAGRIAESERIALACALVAMNDERGGDAWGYWVPDHEIDPVRGLGTMRANVAAAQLAAFATLCAHTRYATYGTAENVRNAHPFEHRDVIGAHNGAVWNADTLDLDYPMRDFDVDSQHLIAHIAESRPLAELTGYGTVVYTARRRPGRVYMGRFSGELAVATLAGERGLAWSSDRAHLHAALKLAGMRATMLHVKERRWHFADSGRLVNTGEKINVGEQVIPMRAATTKSATDYADVYDNRTGKWTRTYRAWSTSDNRELSSALHDGFATLSADGDDAGDNDPWGEGARERDRDMPPGGEG